MIDAATLRQIWDEHSNRLLLIARAIGEPAEDAVQDAFVSLAGQRDLPSDPLAWLVKVTRNHILQSHRGRLRRRQRETAVCERVWFRNDTLLIQDQIDSRQVTEALRAMPSPQREIIVMHLWGEMTFESIAKIVGGSRAKAHRSYAAGLQQLRKQFNPDNSVADRQAANT